MRPGLEGVKVGDTLYLFSINGRRRRPGEPRGDGEAVTVTKVGRKLVTIERYGRPEQYRIETGVANDNYGHEWLETAETRDLKRRRAEARETLRRLGLEPIMHRVPSSERLIEMAERLADLEPES